MYKLLPVGGIRNSRPSSSVLGHFQFIRPLVTCGQYEDKRLVMIQPRPNQDAQDAKGEPYGYKEGQNRINTSVLLSASFYCADVH